MKRNFLLSAYIVVIVIVVLVIVFFVIVVLFLYMCRITVSMRGKIFKVTTTYKPEDN
jgi:hypothetical protein